MMPTNTTYTINIKRKKNQTIATLFDSDGKYIKHAIAKCHYKDDFNIEIGEKLAMERLFLIQQLHLNQRFFQKLM